MEGKEKKRKKDEGPKEVEKKTKMKTEDVVGKMKSYTIKKPELCTDATVYLSAVLGIRSYLAASEVKKDKENRIDPSHLQKGIVSDPELDKYEYEKFYLTLAKGLSVDPVTYQKVIEEYSIV